MEEKFFKSELEKDIFISAYTFYSVSGCNTQQRLVFRSEIERKIWISAYTRGVPKSGERTARDRAKRAWELVLEFRQPSESPEDGWARAARELAGG